MLKCPFGEQHIISTIPCSFNCWCSKCTQLLGLLFLLQWFTFSFTFRNFYFSLSKLLLFILNNFYFLPSITFTFYLQKLSHFYWYQVYLQVEMFSCSSHVLSVIKINFHWSINVEIKSTASKYPDKIKKYQYLTGNYHLGHRSLFYVIGHFFDDRKKFGFYFFAKLA